jgi:hypothetical protein
VAASLLPAVASAAANKKAAPIRANREACDEDLLTGNEMAPLTEVTRCERRHEPPECCGADAGLGGMATRPMRLLDLAGVSAR